MTIYFYTSLFLMLCFSYIIIKKNYKEFYVFLSLVLIVIASFRWNVGGDWDSYLFVYERQNYHFFSFINSITFELINFIFSYFNFGIYSVNLFISSLFFLSLYKICNTLKFNLLLILLITFSLIYFYGIMGYVRQTLALTLFIFSLNYFFKNRIYFSILFFLLGVLTHITILVFMPMYLYAFRRHVFKLIIISLLILIQLFINFKTLETFYFQFLEHSLVSKGAFIRIIPLIFCNIIFILNYKKIFLKNKNLNIFLVYSFIMTSFLIVVLFSTNGNSAIIDRLCFYFTIYQLIVIGSLFSNLLIYHKNYLHYGIFVSLFYFSILFSWFLFGDYSFFWMNYKFIF